MLRGRLRKDAIMGGKRVFHQVRQGYGEWLDVDGGWHGFEWRLSSEVDAEVGHSGEEKERCDELVEVSNAWEIVWDEFDHAGADVGKIQGREEASD